MKLLKLKNLKIPFFGFLILCIGYIFLSINVSKTISKDDIEAIITLNVDKSCKKIKGFESQIKCIKDIQKAQKSLIKSEECRTGIINVEPKNFLKSNNGCCYDRSRIIEKALTFYKFKVRKIFLIDISKGYISLILPKVNSHSVIEVKTSKGWMGIETVQPYFLLINDSNKPLSFKMAINTNYNFPKKEFYYKKPLSIIGLYSRHGGFHKPYFPLPEVNFKDFFSMNFNR